MRSSFLSQQAVERFLGYMNSQHERMLGQSKQNVPNRPELIEKYGWDVKYGSHSLRLAYQGFEIAGTGNLSLPLLDEAARRCSRRQTSTGSRPGRSTLSVATGDGETAGHRENGFVIVGRVRHG